MQDTLKNLNLRLAFENWAAAEGLDLTICEGESAYNNSSTFDAWRGFYAAHGSHEVPAAGQQLYAEIKKSSKYACQVDLCRNSPYGYPFKVCIVEDFGGYVVKGGIGGQYRIADVNLYVMQDGKKIRLH
jgi:hypothetical protein